MKWDEEIFGGPDVELWRAKEKLRAMSPAEVLRVAEKMGKVPGVRPLDALIYLVDVREEVKS